MRTRRAHLHRLVLAGSVLAGIVGLASPSAGLAQTLVPVTPAEGQSFSWGEVRDSGVPIAVQGTPGLFSVDVRVARDPALTGYADSTLLFEEAPGRYEGTVLNFLFDPESEAGLYFWQASYDGLDPVTFEPRHVVGPVRSFSITPPYRAPRLALSTRGRAYVRTRYAVVLSYRPGSDSSADRLHVVATAAPRCPERPDEGIGRSLVSDAQPPSDGELEVPIRHRRLGVFRVCGYVTSNGQVTGRDARRVEVVRRPVPKRVMLRWRLSARGIGPIRIGMTNREIEAITGRSVLFGYGDYVSCQEWSLAGAPGLSLMRAYGRLVRVAATEEGGGAQAASE